MTSISVYNSKNFLKWYRKQSATVVLWAPGARDAPDVNGTNLSYIFTTAKK